MSEILDPGIHKELELAFNHIEEQSQFDSVQEYIEDFVNFEQENFKF